VTLWDPAVRPAWAFMTSSVTADAPSFRSLQSGRALSRWPAHAGPRPAVHRVAWRDGAALLTAGADGDALLWDVRSPLALPALRLFSAPRRRAAAPPALRHAAWAPGRGSGSAPSLLAVAAAEAESAFVVDVRVAGGAEPATLAELCLEQGCINALAWAPRGAHLAAALSDARMVVWQDLITGQDTPETPPPPPPPPPPRSAIGGHARLQPSYDFAAAAELNAIAWSGPHPGRVAVAHGSTVQVLVV